MPKSIYTLSCEDAISFICESAWGFAEVDSSGKFVWINKAYAETLNAPQELILGTHYTEWTHPDDIEIDNELAQQVKEGLKTGYTLAKRYKKYGYPPNQPRYTWGLLSVVGNWNKTGEFAGYRVTYREYNHIQQFDRKQLVQAAKDSLLWIVSNWKTAITIAAIVMSLIFGGSERLLSVLRKAKDTQEQVDTLLRSDESLSLPGQSPASPSP